MWGDKDVTAVNGQSMTEKTFSQSYRVQFTPSFLILDYLPRKKDSLFGSTLTSLNSNGFGGILNSEIVKTYNSGYYSKLQASYKRFGDFETPNYKVRVGNFRTRLEADRGLVKVQKEFKSAFVFKPKKEKNK